MLWSARKALVLVVACAPLVAGANDALTDPEATVAPDSVPAAGERQALVETTRFGRFAIFATSDTGTAIELVDRMAGPRARDGQPGVRDGRIDTFLDAGTYLIRTYGHDLANGVADIAVRPFRERHPGPPRALVEERLIAGELHDFERQSYWLQVPTRRTVVVEAGGRSLTDLRWWRDGSWLVDAAPQNEIVQPVTGKPLHVCRLTAVLEPGLYRLSAYGGPAQPWAEESGDHPFYLRAGIPQLPEASRRRMTISPFGTDRYLVPKATSFYRVELAEARPFELRVAPLDLEQVFVPTGDVARIQKETIPPVAEIASSCDTDRCLVTVSADAGQAYLLQQFPTTWEHQFQAHGPHWLTTVHSGHPADSIDATAIVLRRPIDGSWEPTPFAAQVVELSPRHSWRRRFNLLEPATLFLNVRRPGRYAVRFGEHTGGRLPTARIEPYWIDGEPEGYVSPEFQRGDSTWDLDRGYHLLTLRPHGKGKGIVEVEVSDALRPIDWARPDPQVPPLAAGARFENLSLDADHVYQVRINRQPGVRAGVILRGLPAGIEDGLPLALAPLEMVDVPVRVDEPSELRVVAEDGAELTVSVDGGAWSAAPVIPSGTHTVRVRNLADRTLVANAISTPVSRLPGAELPPLPPEAIPGLPDFPVLTADAPRFFDLERKASATYVVRADRPGLYRIESTGLLATAGNLRTQTTLSLDRQSENGIGRNFLFQRYLRAGDYQVTVSTVGKSRGHLGLALRSTEILDGGVLSDGIPGRATVPAAAGVAYRFSIDDPGVQHHLRILGVGRTLAGRIEDHDGWPLETPGQPIDRYREFAVGDYRVIALPRDDAGAAGGRTLTSLVMLPAPPRYDGHGPHRLPLDVTAHHQWLEPDGPDAERLPDVWSFELPAPSTVDLTLTGDMHGHLRRVDAGGGGDPTYLPPRRGGHLRLERGRYELSVTCIRRDSRVDYAVAVRPTSLVPGLTRDAVAPGTIDLSIGEDAMVELGSFGDADVRARLVDASGRLIAADDDRDDDWNFLISEPLGAGVYRLELDPVGSERANTSVSLRVLEQIDEGPIRGPLETALTPGDATHVWPLQLPTTGSGVVVVAARSTEAVGIAVEVQTSDGWLTSGQARGTAPLVAVPTGAEAALRLRLWSVDRRGHAVSLRVTSARAPGFGEAKARRGIRGLTVPGLEPAVALASVELDGPGTFALSDPDEVTSSDSPGGGFRAPTRGLVVATTERLWLLARGARAAEPLRLTRVRLGAEPVTIAAGGAVTLDVDADPDRLVVVTASATVGQPVVTLAAGGSGRQPRADPAVALADRAALAAGRAGDHALVWLADDEAVSADVRLSAHTYAEPPTEPASWGGRDGVLDGGEAHGFGLPDGLKRLRLSLDPDVVALLADGSEILSVHWGGGRAAEETIDSRHSRLTLLSVAGDASHGRYRFEVIRAEVEPARLPPGSTLERSATRSGSLRVELPAAGADDAATTTLELHGAVEGAVLLRADGSVVRGRSLEVGGGGGFLTLEHRAGQVLAWRSTTGDDGGRYAWGSIPPPLATALELPAVLHLAGPSSAYRIRSSGTSEDPSLLHVRTRAAVVTRLERGDGEVEVDIHPDGCVLDAYLADGAATLALRALGHDTELSGTVEITTTPILPIGEGLGPELVLPPGATRGFAFEVTRAGAIGVGVRSDGGGVESTLLDASGRHLGTGVVQMPTVLPGTYVLLVTAPADGLPVRVQPALAGVQPPATGPPPDVIRGYLQSAGAIPIEGEQR